MDPVRDPDSQALIFPPDEREAEINYLRLELNRLRQASLLLVDFLVGQPGSTLPEIRKMLERKDS